MCVCMGMLQMGIELFQEFGPKGFSWGRTEGGLLVIWPGESAFFSFGEDRLWNYILCSVIPSVSVDFSQTVFSLLLQPSKCVTLC